MNPVEYVSGKKFSAHALDEKPKTMGSGPCPPSTGAFPDQWRHLDRAGCTFFAHLKSNVISNLAPLYKLIGTTI